MLSQLRRRFSFPSTFRPLARLRAHGSSEGGGGGVLTRPLKNGLSYEHTLLFSTPASCELGFFNRQESHLQMEHGR